MSGAWSGARMGGNWSGGRVSNAARVGGPAGIRGASRMAAVSGGMGNWNNGNWRGGNWRGGNWNGNWRHGHFRHRRNNVFFVGVGGGPWWWGNYGYYDDGCWQWVDTRWGLRRVWACGDLY